MAHSAGTPIPLRASRASLLLRLQTPTALRCIQLHPLGALLLAGGDNGDVLLFATASGGLIERLAEPGKSTSPATCVAWAEVDGAERVIAGHKSGNVRVRDMERGAVVSTLVAHRADVEALAYMAPLGLLATGSVDTNIKLWPLLEGNSSTQQKAALVKEPQATLKGHAAPITHLQFTPDGELLISGDSGGGLRVWHVASGRLLHDLSGHHTAAITGIACHPEERLFVTCALDRTLRVWDMDSQPGKCIGVHGPEGRREVRAVAFASGGRALLAAYPDGLRTFSLDPLVHHDTADLQWSKVTSIRYTDGKVIGISLFKGDAGLHCVDLTKMKPFAKARTSRDTTAVASSGAIVAEESLARKMRFSEKYQVPAPTSASQPQPIATHSTSIHAVRPSDDADAAQPGAAALFVAQQRRQAAVLEPKSITGGPAVEMYATHRSLRQTQPVSFTAAPSKATASQQPAAPSNGMRAAVAPSVASSMPPAGRVSPGGEIKGGRHRLSAEENTLLGSRLAGSNRKPEAPASKPPAGQLQQPAAAAAAGVQLPAPSMLAVATHQGFLAAGMQGHWDHCGLLRAKRSLLREVQCAVQQRGDVQAAVRILRNNRDLGVITKVTGSRAIQCRADKFSLELCTDAVPLIGALLASSTTLHHQAALQLLEDVLERWGSYVRGVLSNAPRQNKVDLELERRQETSRALRARLQELLPALEKLSVPLGGGRAKQMLARVKAL